MLLLKIVLAVSIVVGAMACSIVRDERALECANNTPNSVLLNEHRLICP